MYIYIYKKYLPSATKKSQKSSRYPIYSIKAPEIQAAATPESITITMKLSKNTWIELPEWGAASKPSEMSALMGDFL